MRERGRLCESFPALCAHCVSLLLRTPGEERGGDSWELGKRRPKVDRDSTLGGVLSRQHSGEESTYAAGDATDVGSIPGLGRPRPRPE